MDAGAQPGGAYDLELARLAAGQLEAKLAMALGLDQESGASVEECLFVGKQRGQRAPRQVAIVALQQATGGAVGVEDELVAGDDEPFLDELEQGQIDPGFSAFRQVGDEGFERRRRQARRSSRNIHGRRLVRLSE